MIRLFAITDAEKYPDFVAQSETLCAGAKEGSVAIVLREYGAPGRRLCEWAYELRETTARFRQKLFIADRVDLAELVGADGVHLPSAGFAPQQVPPDSELAVSRSGHNLEKLSDADWNRLSAVWISPVAAPKKGREELGETGLREKAERVKRRAPHVDVYALGGVTGAHVFGCLRAGASGVAAIGAVWGGEERRALLNSLHIER